MKEQAVADFIIEFTNYEGRKIEVPKIKGEEEERE